MPKELNTVSCPAGDSDTASLNIPHGSAPSTPANGDVWTTTDGLYIRVNGVTKGPYVTQVSLTLPAAEFSVSGSPGTGAVALTGSWIYAPTSASTANAIVKRDGNSDVEIHGITATGGTKPYLGVRMPVPGSPTSQLLSGGSLTTSTTYYYKVTALDGDSGETTVSSETSQTTTSGSKKITVTWSGSAYAYRLYRGTTSGGQNKYVQVTAATTYTDDGTVTFSDGSPPGSNTAYLHKWLDNYRNWILGTDLGIGTHNPTGALHIYRSNAAIKLDSSTDYNLSPSTSLQFGGKYNTSNSFSTFAKITGGKANTTDGNASGYLALSSYSGFTENECIRLTDDPRIGLFTTKPQAHVVVGDGKTLAIEMQTPYNVSPTSQTGGSLTQEQTYYFKVSARDSDNNDTAASSSVSVYVTAPNNAVNVTWASVTNASTYRVWYSTDNTNWKYYEDSASPYLLTTDGGTTGTPPTSTTAYLTKLAATGDSFVKNGVVRVPSGVNFNSSGGDTLSYYDEGSYTGTLTGMTGSVTLTMRFVRVGKLVTLVAETASQVTGTSNSTTMTMTGMPSALYPVAAVYGIANVKDNDNFSFGTFEINTSGVVTFGKSAGALDNFTSSGTKGLGALSVSYCVG
jgi:hypothetical protein